MALVERSVCARVGGTSRRSKGQSLGEAFAEAGDRAGVGAVELFTSPNTALSGARTNSTSTLVSHSRDTRGVRRLRLRVFRGP